MSRKYVTVMFTSNSHKEYTYLTDLDLAPDDKVIVDSPHDGFVVVTVIKVRGIPKHQLSKATKWVVQKVDTAAYEERVKKQEVIQEIKNKLAERREEMEELLIYKTLAKEDVEIKNLLDELNELENPTTLLTEGN